MGTIGVREYLKSRRDSASSGLELNLPEFNGKFPTSGPLNRYGAILYVEKEGFLPLLQHAGFAERYDLAIMSSKGMGTTAVRKLIENLFERVKILVLHDFDKSGFSILGTLTRDTRRYAYLTEPLVIDLGLRLADVEKWKLQAEEVVHNGDPRQNLRLNGATPAETEFLRGERVHGHGGRFKGQRVELNAFTSEDFVHWLESKLTEHNITKVIPDAATLDIAYRRATAIRRYRTILQSALRDVEAHASGMEIPTGLRDRIVQQLGRTPSISWDEAIDLLLLPDISA